MERMENAESFLFFLGIAIGLFDFILIATFLPLGVIEFRLFEIGIALVAFAVVLFVLNPIWERCWLKLKE